MIEAQAREKAERLVIEIFDHPNAPNLEPSPTRWIQDALFEAYNQGRDEQREEDAKLVLEVSMRGFSTPSMPLRSICEYIADEIRATAKARKK